MVEGQAVICSIDYWFVLGRLRQRKQDVYWREDDGGIRPNVEQLILTGLVAWLFHLIATLQRSAELIPRSETVEYY